MNSKHDDLRRTCRKISVLTKKILSKLNRSQKLFFWGILIIIYSFLWYPFWQKAWLYTLFLGIFLLFLGVVSDILFIYNKVWATSIGKAFLLIIYALGTTIAYGLSGQVVNEIVQFDSSVMTKTINFVSILLIPLFIFITITVIFTIFIIFWCFYILFIQAVKDLKIKIKLEYYPWWTFVGRVISYILVFSCAFALQKLFIPGYSQFIKNYTSSFIYHVESVRFSRCKNIPSNSRVIPINNDEIIVITKIKNSYVFDPIACDARLSPETKK